MQVVDPHIHLLNYTGLRYSWLHHESHSFVGSSLALAHDYLLADFLRDAGDIEVLAIVNVEANHDPDDTVAETRWLQAVADDPASGGKPDGIVARVDLSRPDADAQFALHAQCRNLRGIRQILNVHADPLYDYVGRHYLREATWRAHYGLLAKYGLSFDLQLYPEQVPDAVALIRAHPDIPVVLDHAGMFVDRDRVAGWRAWREGLRQLAACEHVSVKISGLAMFDHRWTVESFRPYVLETIDAFGAGRCMFASNFPVDRLFAGYAELWHAYAAIVAGASPHEHAALFRDNARRFYRL
ncbi:putative TIM-barrel fold metal-dependent hydrolase [Plasticicumulans lactativorans]|uniref:Putative TIM-barrel fold metal-dependent hydrolase n=1 Tax=Plasticicumulans lactativorans TaxID=1133106 RepID=A0A4R2L349_9GAMM|nr:amidohydrolase family protein [Plasticicumulans lactativorans]TCO80793.1 putative TIM-barrel fold metal-dependent hydrolase [Plasticicumulans lactativorans]